MVFLHASTCRSETGILRETAEPDAMKIYNIALIGFGGVNRALAELVAARNETWQQTLGFGLNIVGVSDLNYGSVISPNGIDPRVLAGTRFQKGGFGQLSGGSAESRALDVIRNAPADIVVEATFTNASTGEPAISYCRAAFEAGRSVATTNKGPVALAARELKDLAGRRGVAFEYEGTVMSGTPVIRLARQAMSGADITGFEGILNGTSNFILSRMEARRSFADAVSEAQSLGYAEADPTADVEGYDVRLKVVILANEILGANLGPGDVACSGIAELQPSDIESAMSEGRRWKLIGGARRLADGGVEASVSAVSLPDTHPLASVSGATNAVRFTTELLQDVTIVGPGAGRTETAFALLSDIVSIHRARSHRDSAA